MKSTNIKHKEKKNGTVMHNEEVIERDQIEDVVATGAAIGICAMLISFYKKSLDVVNEHNK